MEWLVFQLQAPMSSWGVPAVGETRGTASWASQSALVGLLGAALGLRREDEAAHASLRDGFGFAVALLSEGSLLRDYHTAQVPPRTALKNRAHATRRDELSVDKEALGTTQSWRDYRVNAACLVALQPRPVQQGGFTLQTLADALRRPKFTLFVGRKSCPPAAPLWPQVIDAASALDAFARYADRYETARRQAQQRTDGSPPLEPLPPAVRIAFDDHTDAGIAPQLTTVRKDRLIRRKGWQFGDRYEHVTMIGEEA